jgi:hypothetical protein
MAKTGSATTHMPILPWPSGVQDTWQAHPCILPRIWPDLGSPGLFHLWALTIGAIVTMPRRSATLHRFPLAIVPVVGCSLACAPHHHPLAPCAVEDHVPVAPCALEDHVPDVRTRLVRLPWGPLTQAQDVNPWFGRPPARLCP